MSRLVALAAMLVLIVLFLSGLTSFGLTGPDEPRYASIGRDMAAAGDWITPRLWGQGWFEKPPLLYWMIGTAFRLGAGTDLAPRLPVALASLAFLGFYFAYLRREFNLVVGAIATGLLSTSALWVGYSHAAVTDIPLSITSGAVCLLLLPAVEGREAPVGLAAVLLALSVLAKGLLPVILLLPFAWFARSYWRKWLKPVPVLLFSVAVLPWYVLCQMRNPEFFRIFFLQQQLGRFTSPDLQHVQPFWFYVPVMIGALFPSTLLCGWAFWPRLYQDRRRQFLGVVVLFGLVFLSASRNKLPGYILPLLPAACILAACGMDAARALRSRQLAWLLAVSVLLLPSFIVAARVLPHALNGGLRELWPLDMTTAKRLGYAVPLGLCAAVCLLYLSRAKAILVWFALSASGWIYIEYAALPWLDATSSARTLWRELPEPKTQFCVGALNRNWRYGLNYYSVQSLPDCESNAWSAILPGNRPADRPRIELRIE